MSGNEIDRDATVAHLLRKLAVLPDGMCLRLSHNHALAKQMWVRETGGRYEIHALGWQTPAEISIPELAEYLTDGWELELVDERPSLDWDAPEPEAKRAATGVPIRAD